MPKRPAPPLPSETDPLWYRDAIIYQVHVRAFFDGDDDGAGDFKGLTRKLDYLQDLGVTALWLLPFYPSPLRDDGYDIADYNGVHPDFGSLRDFRTFLREAHRRDLRIITELVVNHTSDQHRWFQRARRARPGSRARDFYVWSDTPERYQDARIIFQDFEGSNWSWDPMAKAYFWHRFYSHQPDLNFDNPRVREAIIKAMEFWLDMGVDGMRLDAVPYLFEREGTSCENLPETHGFLKELRRHLEERYPDRMLLAEANQWPEDAAAYFGTGDECQMAFHFPVMPRLFMAVHMEDRFPIVDILDQTPAIPDGCQWAIFLRNHDELTLEMVTDEERDYMYRVYARDPRARINLGIRRRLAPLLANDRRKIELLNGFLFSLPGTPIVYYGDEIGMGDNYYLGDRNGVRTPMQWSSDRNAGFSRANPQRLYLPTIIDPEYHYEALNVEAQQHNPSSLLWWMKRLIALRKRYRAFGRGSLELLHPDNPKILAFVRRFEDETLLVVANLSRFVQHTELNLGDFAGTTPVELFGHNEFPRINRRPYPFTLGPHSFYWFALTPKPAGNGVATTPPREEAPILTVRGAFESVLEGRARERLEAQLPAYMAARRWFGGKSRGLKSARIVERIPIPTAEYSAWITLVRVEYVDGEPETYVLPLGIIEGERADLLTRSAPWVVVATLARGESRALLADPSSEPMFAAALLDAITRRRRLKGDEGAMSARRTAALRAVAPAREGLVPEAVRSEQSNTSVVFGSKLILKLFRRVEAGINPDLEITRYLTSRGFPHSPPLAGSLEYRSGRDSEATLGMLQAFIPNEGDAWRYTLGALAHYYERVLAHPELLQSPPEAPALFDVIDEEPGTLALELVGTYLESARLLGERTAELHLALAAETDDPEFQPEPFTAMSQRSLYQSLRTLANRSFATLRRQLRRLPEDARKDASRVLEARDKVMSVYGALLTDRITATRIRCHGDYHLGQVLHTGRDFVIIDFEGEPARPLGERRLKRTPLRDVAGMLRSFHYAVHTALASLVERGLVRPDDRPTLEPWARFWYLWVGGTFLRAYRDVAARGDILPRTTGGLHNLLDAFLLDKALYELGYELDNRPDWVRIPLLGILELLESRGDDDV